MKKTLTKNVQVGIFENCEYVARIYADKIVVITPHVKWVGNTGGYAERKDTIRDANTIARVCAAISADNFEAAWAIIGYRLDDGYLQCAV